MQKLILSVAVFGMALGRGIRAQDRVPSIAAHGLNDIAGDWQGSLEWAAKGNQPAGKIRIVVKIAKGAAGGWNAVDYSIDQDPRGMACSSVTLEGSIFKYSIPSIKGSYEGKLSADGNTIVGAWTQHGSLPLVFVRATKETAWEMPELPRPAVPMAADADPSVEAATIKPNVSGAPSLQAMTMDGHNFVIKNGSLADMIAAAYDIQIKQIVDGPAWIDKDRYDIHAVPDQPGSPNLVQLKSMFRKLLADRYQLRIHHEKREMSAYVLKLGAKTNLSRTQSRDSLPALNVGGGAGGLTLRMTDGTMTDLASYLQMVVLDKPVIDQTALAGKYDCKVTFTPDDSQFSGHPPKVKASEVIEAPDLYTSFQQQLGLKLAAEKTQVDVVVIEHVEKPSPN